MGGVWWGHGGGVGDLGDLGALLGGRQRNGSPVGRLRRGRRGARSPLACPSVRELTAPCEGSRGPLVWLVLHHSIARRRSSRCVPQAGEYNGSTSFAEVVAPRPPPENSRDRRQLRHIGDARRRQPRFG